MKRDIGQALAVVAGLLVGSPFVLLGGPAILAVPLAIGAGVAAGYLLDRLR